MRICFHLLELVDGLFFVSFFIDQFYSHYISFNVILVFPLFLTFLVYFIIILRNWIWNYVKRPTSRMEYAHNRWPCRWLASFLLFFLPWMLTSKFVFSKPILTCLLFDCIYNIIMIIFHKISLCELSVQLISLSFTLH